MTDETPNPTAPEPEADPTTTRPPAADPDSDPTAPEPAGPRRAVSSADAPPRRPDYRGAELDPERGPGLGCFWFQLIVLAFFIVIIPIGLELNWPFELLAILLFVVIGLLLLTGQSVIFLLRLVAADRRAAGRRRPLASPTKTVGEIEDDHRATDAVGSKRPAEADPAPDDTLRDSESMIRESRVAETLAEGENVSDSAAAPDLDVDSGGADAVDGGVPRTDSGVDIPTGGMAGGDAAAAAVRTHESLPERHEGGASRTGDTGNNGDTRDAGAPEDPDPGVRQ